MNQFRTGKFAMWIAYPSLAKGKYTKLRLSGLDLNHSLQMHTGNSTDSANSIKLAHSNTFSIHTPNFIFMAY